MRFWHRLIRTLRLPSNAGPDDPQTIIGPDIDDQLAAYYDPALVVSNIIFQYQEFSNGDVVAHYIAQIVPELSTPYIAVGVIGETLGSDPFVRESFRVSIGPGGGGTAPLIVGDPFQTFPLNSGAQFLGPLVLGLNDGQDSAASATFTIDNVAAPRGVRGEGTGTTVGTVATSSGTEVAIPAASWTTEPEADFYDGRLYQVDVQVGAFPSAATNSITRVRLRKGSATITGTLLCTWWLQMNTQTATTAPTFMLTGYVKNTSGAKVTTKLSVTNTRHGGAASTSLFMNSSTPLPGILVVRDIGAVADWAALAAVAVSV